MRPEPEWEDPALIQRAQSGDQAAMCMLVERFRPMLWALARRMRCADSVSRHELVQAGVLGLIRAVERYDAGRGTKLTTYAVPWILGEMRQMLRETLTGCISLDEAEEQTGLTLMERLCGSDGVDMEGLAMRLAIERLDEQAQMLICLRYFRGYTQSEAARLLHRSQTQISRMERRALEQLKEILTP